VEVGVTTVVAVAASADVAADVGFLRNVPVDDDDPHGLVLLGETNGTLTVAPEFTG